MYQPRPHGLSAVGGELTEEDSAAVELLARRLTNLKSSSGVSSLRMVRTLPDGGYVIAQDCGGVFKAITHKPLLKDPEVELDGIATPYIPMLFSGAITKSIVREQWRIDEQGPLPEFDLVRMRITEMTRQRIAGYDQKDREKLPPSELQLQRFTIDYNDLFQEFIPPNVPLRHTQYAAQRPTWYSGAMAEVMQIVGGYGRQDLAKLREDKIEQAKMTLPKKVMRKIETQLINVRLPGYNGVPPKDGKFQYDYKFHNTNAVSFDSSGNPWLLQVSKKGVYAMPLPIIPATETEEFSEWIKEVGDNEIEAIIDRFGGMPSGEGFPEHDEYFEAWRRAGVIIKVCDTSTFYDHIAYASSTGWSFNLSGTEGFNTCYDYDDDGFGFGLAFKMSLKLGPADGKGKLPPFLNVDDPVLARKIDYYLGGIYSMAKRNTPENLAIKYKIRRSSLSQIASQASKGTVTVADYDYWDRLELEPIATHSGTVVQVGKGNLYSPIRFKHQPQIKFPEPFAQGCISHDFLPLGVQGMNFDPGGGPKCDTIVFGYYAEDDLKVIKYFRNAEPFTQKIESDFEECMTVGSWTETVYTGDSRILGNFYLTDIDKRDTVSQGISVTEIEGRDRGYDRQPWFNFDFPLAETGTMYRMRYFEKRTKTSSSDGLYLKVGVCVPFYNRNAVLHAFEKGTQSGRQTDGNSLESVQDPHTYRFHTYHQYYAFRGGTTIGNMATVTKVDPEPSEGNPVWVKAYNYYPYPCSDFADQGDWVGGLPSDYTWLIHPDANVFNFSGGGGAPAFVKFFTEKTNKNSYDREISFSAYVDPKPVHKREINDGYFQGSPDDEGFIFYRDSCRTVFGAVTYCNVSEFADGNERRKHWGHTKLADHNGAYHFIGVINE